MLSEPPSALVLLPPRPRGRGGGGGGAAAEVGVKAPLPSIRREVESMLRMLAGLPLLTEFFLAGGGGGAPPLLTRGVGESPGHVYPEPGLVGVLDTPGDVRPLFGLGGLLDAADRLGGGGAGGGARMLEDLERIESEDGRRTLSPSS